jgi:hypothetical protein
MHYTTIDPKKSKIGTHDHALHHHWWPPKRQRFEPMTCTHYTKHWLPQNAKYSNPRPCTTQPLIPKRQKFEPKTIHYTTIDDPRKDKDSNPRHALHHHWLPKSQRFEPTTMHYTTNDEPEKTKIRTQDHALHNTIDNLHWHFNGVHMVIDDVPAHNPKHLCNDVTAHVNPKHLYDETMCYSVRIGVKTRLNNSSKRPNFHLSTELGLWNLLNQLIPKTHSYWSTFTENRVFHNTDSSKKDDVSMEKLSNHKNTWIHRAISTETLENKNNNG